jgi:hypothetical protein
MWSPNRRLQFELTMPPLVGVKLHDGWNIDDLAFMFERFTTVWEARQRYAFIMDTSLAHNAPNASERQLIASWSKANERQVERWSVGAAIIFKSALIRGSLTAIAWISHSARPTVYVANRAEAGRWCTERLREANEPLTHEVQRYLGSDGVSPPP